MIELQKMVGLIKFKLADGTEKSGTVFVIREGVILTANHNLPNNFNIEKHKKSDETEGIFWPEGKGTPKKIESFLYQCSDTDVAILKCQTPNIITPFPPPSNEISNPHENLQILGYPKFAVKNNSLETLDSFAAKSEGEVLVNDSVIIKVKCNASIEPDWEDGLSGAPVIKLDQNNKPMNLLGFIVKTGLYIEKLKTKNALQDGVIVAHSIRTLLKNSKNSKNSQYPNFFIAFFGKEKETYQEKQKQELKQQLTKISSLDAQKMITDNFIAGYTPITSDWIKQLRNYIPNSLNKNEAKEWKKLLFLLLSQADIQSPVTKKNFHQFKVLTALLSEVVWAQLHDTTPRFKESEKGEAKLQGEFVFNHSVVETGFEQEKGAEQLANNVAHAIYKQRNEEAFLEPHSDRAIQAYKDLDGLLADDIKDGLLHRYEVNTSTDLSNHILMNENTRNYLQSNLLKNLLISSYGKGTTFDGEALLASNIAKYIKKIKENTI